MLNGFMLPNYEWQDWTDDQIVAIIALRPTILLIPIYSNTNPFSARKRLQIVKLSGALPGCMLLYRIMGKNNMLNNPIDWVRETQDRVGNLPVGSIIPTNEDNIEGMGEDWDSIVAWWLSYLSEMTSYSVHMSALSPVGNYREGWRRLSTIRRWFSAIDIHIYPGNEIDLPDAQHYFGGCALYVTEYNEILPTRMNEEAAGFAEGVVWFIFAGTPDQQRYALVEPYLSDFRKVTTVATAQRKYAHGADISSNNGPVSDWEQLARCIDFLEIKVNEYDYLNPLFADSRQAAEDHGLVTILYDFARPSLGSGHDEAQKFLDRVGTIRSGEIPMLDMEDMNVHGDADLLAYTVDWKNTVKAAWVTPMLYSADWYLKPHNLETHTELAECGLNYAFYGVVPPTVPKPWDTWAIWQYSDRGSLPGLVKAVDLDLFNGTIDQLRKYGKP